MTSRNLSIKMNGTKVIQIHNKGIYLQLSIKSNISGYSIHMKIADTLYEHNTYEHRESMTANLHKNTILPKYEQAI